MTSRLRPITLLTVLLLWFVSVPRLVADSDDHDRARQALEAGEILPLRTLLDRLEGDYPGQVIEVELEREDGRWVYEIKLLRPNGVLVKMNLDAVSGTLLGIKGRDIAPGPQ
jgi:uncharacterized membrane protein YkoI